MKKLIVYILTLLICLVICNKVNAQQIINSESSLFLVLSFTDENNNSVTPSSIIYQILGPQNVVVVGPTTIYPSGPTYTIEITPTENTVANQNIKYNEVRNVGIRFVYNGSRQGTTAYKYMIRNIPLP